MRPSLGEYHEGIGAELECPACKGFHLHHEHIEVFERAEDEPRGLHVTVVGGKATVDNDLQGNPSSRRDGMIIHFSCETCDAKPKLTIVQHKGSTYVDLTAET